MPTFRQDNKLGDSVPLIKTPDIGDKQVTERKLADGSVTSSKLSTEIANMLSLLTTRISAFKVADNLSSLPTEENTIGWLVDNHLYVYVGNGSTPESGMYQDCGELRGPQGIQGEQGLSGLNGKSAYDIWTEQPGNEDKSEIDFLEFTRGSKGDKGDKGERGYDISNIEQIVKSAEDGGKNIIRVTRSDGWSKVFEILNGSKGSKGDKGTSIVKLEQTRKTTESSGLNTIEATLGDGTKESFEIYNGAKGEQGDKGEKGDKGEVGMQGNSGVADASNKALVNDAITGGETDFLSAEVGKLGILTYDCSKGGTITHTTLQDAINSVPTAFQKVGLNITYKSGDTIYRYTLKANAWSADPSNWFSVEEKLSDLSTIVGTKTKISITSNYNQPVNISLKKGDTLYLSVSSFNKNGIGDAVICFFSSTTRKYFCQLRNDGEEYYTADSDVIIDKLQVNLASGVTNVSAEIKFAYGQIYTNKQLIENQSKEIANNVSNIDDILNVQVGKTISFDDTLSTVTLPNVATIKGNFCKGQKISLITRNFSVQYTGNIALALYNPISKKYDATFNGNSSFGNQKVFGDVSANTNTYLLQMIVSGGSITSSTGFVQVNIDEIAYETIQEIKSFTPILGVMKASDSDYINFATKSITGWIYGSKGNDIIFGIDRPTDKDIVIKNISMVIFSDDCNYDNTVMEFLVGTIDQRGWVLYNRSFSAKASKVAKMNYKVAIDNEVLKKGECLFVKLKCLSATGATFALDTATYNPNKKVTYTTNINSSVVKDETNGYYGFVVDAVEVESIFAYKQDIENINTDLQAVSSRVDNINILSDTATGDKYKIVITNGEIIAKLLNYKKGLIIGNSYSNYGPSGTTWFSYNCMAASTEKTQWFKLIQSKNGCVFSVKSGVDFERNYSVSYDFSKLGLTNEYDVVIIQLGENTTYSDTMESSFAALIKYIKSICIKADIYVMLGAPAINGDRSTALINAANKNNVQIINCMSVSLVGRYSLGDYVSSESDGMDYIQNSGVSDGHPSDIGQLNIANKCLEIFGNESISDRLFKLNLQQTSGGSITTAYSSWVSSGIVSVRCKAKESYTIQGISVVTISGKSIEATKRTNEYGVYYTFIMPNEDVTITPSFSEL
jgi:hypothetical protein